MFKSGINFRNSSMNLLVALMRAPLMTEISCSFARLGLSQL